MRLASFDSDTVKADPTLKFARYTCWTQAELSYAIMAATIPTARKLMLNFITYYNTGGFSTSMSISARGGSRPSRPGLSSSAHGEAYQMSFLKSISNRKSEITYSGNAERGDGDNESEEMIIRKETTVHIDRDSISRDIPDT
jgi:hypothetical protein